MTYTNLSFLSQTEAAKNNYGNILYDPETGKIKVGANWYTIDGAANLYQSQTGADANKIREWIGAKRQDWNAAQSPAAQNPAAQNPAAQNPAAQNPAAQNPAAQEEEDIYIPEFDGQLSDDPPPPPDRPVSTSPSPDYPGAPPDPNRNPGENADSSNLTPVLNADWYKHTWQQMLDHDKWLNENPWMHQRDDLARGNSHRNVNSQTSAETLRLSRLADALNNQYYRTPYRIDDRIAMLGGGTSGQAAEFGSLYQMPVETEEMRQMDRTRQYETMVRQAEIERQAVTRGLDLEQARARLSAQLAQATGLSDDQRQRVMAIFEWGLGFNTAAYQLRNQQIITHYTNVLTSMRIPRANANFIAQQLTYNPIMSGLYSQMTGGGVTPSQSQVMLMNAAAQSVANLGPSATSEQRLNTFYTSLVRMLQTNLNAAAVQLFGGDTPENREKVQAFISRITQNVQSMFTGSGSGQ